MVNTKRVWIRRISLLGISFLASLLVVEVILRICGLRINTEQEGLSYPFFKANATGTFYGAASRPNEFTVVSKNNSLGFPDKEHNLAKPPNTVRILVVGDSFVEGFQVPLEKRFYKQLEEKLNAQTSDGKHYEVIAFGRQLTGPREYWWMMLNLGLQYKPDIIISEFLIANDITDTSPQLKRMHDEWVSRSLSYEASFNQPVFKALRKSPLIRFRLAQLLFYVLDSNIHTFLTRNVPLTLSLNTDYFVYCKKPPQTAAWEEGWFTIANSYQGMKQDAEKIGADFYLVTFTNPHEIAAFQGRNTLDSKLTPFECDAKYPNDRIDRVAKQLGLNYLNLNMSFAQKSPDAGRQSHYRFDGHWSEMGHAWAAEEIMKAFAEKMLSNKPK